ncbi:MAG: pilus assembly protein [Anaerolineae bacterium]|nr:pilus assembly protein [Anaerolineae bacterium]
MMVMLLGLTEIGWYANNYMTLLDVVREAGRAGATRDPMAWYDGEEKNYQRLDCDELVDKFDKQRFENNDLPRGPEASLPPEERKYGYFIGGEGPIGYYDAVACSVIANMAPLEFKDSTDDIAVSVFSFAVMNRELPVDNPGTPQYVRIVGRYPARTNECDQDDEYDPFDWNRNGSGSDLGEDSARYDAEWDNVRGYVFRGNHANSYGAVDGEGNEILCLGSEFSTLEVEKMLDFQGDSDRDRKIVQTPNFGLVLVEIFWEHQQLLALPWFNFGPLESGSTIHVWSFFPVSAAEPSLRDLGLE